MNYSGTILVGSLTALLLISLGCERKETLVDIDTPGRSVEVERNLDNGNVEIKVDEKR